MVNYEDLIALVRKPQVGNPLAAVWNYAPCHASLVGGISNLRRYYFDVAEKVAAQRLVKQRLKNALVLPGVWPDLGVVTGTTPDVPPENMQSMVAAVYETSPTL